MHTIEYSHWINTSHRLVNHPGKCCNIHGHNYKITLVMKADHLNALGMVEDFGDIKSTFGKWLDSNWDHRVLLWEDDPLLQLIPLSALKVYGAVLVPFNPTAENMAHFLLYNQPWAKQLYAQRGKKVIAVQVEETPNCTATATLDGGY
jgi:6-pyruvoyltetrahydropterin/6-carboxytetrahydropterin synthase